MDPGVCDWWQGTFLARCPQGRSTASTLREQGVHLSPQSLLEHRINRMEKGGNVAHKAHT